MYLNDNYYSVNFHFDCVTIYITLIIMFICHTVSLPVSYHIGNVVNVNIFQNINF